MPPRIQSPERELRFTRSGQAATFWVIAAVFAAIAITMLASSIYRHENPHLPHPAWAMVPAVVSVILARVAVRLTRHAYLIFTPLGIEIFPFFRPAEGMRLVVWQEIDHAAVNARFTMLTLHHNTEESSGIHLSLRPIRKDRRTLLAKAVTGRLSPPCPEN